MNRLCLLILNDLSYGVTDWVYEGTYESVDHAEDTN